MVREPGYLFRPAVQALGWQLEWKYPVYPDGDYFACLTPDLTQGIRSAPSRASRDIVFGVQ
ncbi:DUF2716 domain-containing protein [Nakamurella antarctica]|uniref:DUF2716 domain-containing protein n=1 Tax=Nakamurella antarctica TaxID=1902245 RepID=A0A3G8ZJE4_9ACTN|nr:DUF2716 domain-containing protein [Nakamurella antarctica]AZI56887.1 DUF2716 domain-containing protein [Nakamurella antarctica]